MARWPLHTDGGTDILRSSRHAPADVLLSATLALLARQFTNTHTDTITITDTNTDTDTGNWKEPLEQELEDEPVAE